MKKLNAGRGFRPETPDPRCKEICVMMMAKQRWGVSRYADGQKFCNVCKVFMKTTKIDCPCCNEILKDSA